MGPNRTTRFAAHVAAVPLFAGALACTADNPGYDPPDPVCAAGEYFVGQSFTLADAHQVDILLVVDDSPGMLAAQRALSDAMPRLVTRLNAVDGLDWRVGVVSTDRSDAGLLQVGPEGSDDCPAELPEYVSRSTNSAGLALSCNVLLGQEGSDFEQGLESARLAIEGGATFLRDDARLVVVFFSDEDDCTAGAGFTADEPANCAWYPQQLVPVETYSRYFASAARRRSGNPVSVVAIVAPSDNRAWEPGEDPLPVCVGTGPAYSGSRYLAVAATAPVDRYGFHESVCTTSFVATVDRIVDDAVQIDDDRVCLSLPISGTPRSVTLENTSGAAVGALSENGDYLSLGPVDGCATGALAVSPDAHGPQGHVIEVRYCTTESPE